MNYRWFGRTWLVWIMALVLSMSIWPGGDVHAATSYYVATTGADTNPGTLSQPFRTLNKSLTVLRAGDTLYVRGGTYAENISLSPSKGTSTAPITVRNYSTERPILQGLLSLSGADYWTVDGLNVTWKDGNSASSHMVKFSGGIGWRLQNAELWGAKSFAALLITGGASGWYVGYNKIHDTYPSNSTNQDHLIYLSYGNNGVIERNLLYNSANGRAIKLGPASASSSAPNNNKLRYNTMYNNLGPSNVQLSYGTSNTEIYRNIMVKSGTGYESVTHYNLTGTGNGVHDNVGWQSDGVVEPGNAGLVNTGGNLFRDPLFVDAVGADFHPRDTTSQSYGRYAP